MPLSFDMTNEQKVVGISISPSTTSGKPASIEPGSLAVAIIDGNPNAVPSVEADGTISVASGDGDTGIGSTIVAVSADADLGAGVVTITDTITINVAGVLASNLGLGGGNVVNK